jgi:hypothetical protein
MLLIDTVDVLERHHLHCFNTMLPKAANILLYEKHRSHILCYEYSFVRNYLPTSVPYRLVWQVGQLRGVCGGISAHGEVRCRIGYVSEGEINVGSDESECVWCACWESVTF